jgi:copper ion binding protein
MYLFFRLNKYGEFIMKHVFWALALGLALFACDKSGQGQAETAEIKVPTIQCNRCVAHVERALSGVNGVSAVKVNLESRIAQVSFDPGKTNLAAVEKSISRAGYDANETKSDPDAYAALAACCKVPETSDSNSR